MEFLYIGRLKREWIDLASAFFLVTSFDRELTFGLKLRDDLE